MRRHRRLIVLLCIVAIIIGFFRIKEKYVVPVLMYHNIDENASVSKLSVSPESFKAQMGFLKTHNYNVVSLEELADLIKKGNIPYKTIAITFDDGYENNYTNAFPVLKELGLEASIFISPALIGEDGYSTWEQIIDMRESGLVSIGSHSMTHAYLPGLPQQKLEMEVLDSKRSIESHIRRDAALFSYPAGGFNDYVRDMVIKAGYKIAVATNPGKKYPKHDLFAMKRLRISRTSDNLFVFWIEASGFYTWIKEKRDED